MTMVDYRKNLEKWIIDNINKIDDKQLQELADKLESQILDNEYKEYI
jgi:hypothetical protein